MVRRASNEYYAFREEDICCSYLLAAGPIRDGYLSPKNEAFSLLFVRSSTDGEAAARQK
jgi:hypothetical protein